MTTATLPGPPSSISRNALEDCYQVDNISTSSSSQDSDDETDNTIVAASNEARIPAIESVTVVNSNDVHIGNKTVYQGPVTIKQIVYPNGVVSNLPSDRVNNLERYENNVAIEFRNTVDGIDNPAYGSKDCASQDRTDENKDVANDYAQHSLSGIAKGILWLQNLPKRNKRDLVIFSTILILVITILSAIMFWKHPLATAADDARSDTDIDEDDNNTPIEYASDSNSTINNKLQIIPRLQWLAQPPTHESDLLKTPVPLVIIQHTATESCISTAQCVYLVRHIQNFHIESNQWWDIGYSFLVGGDGNAYEGRGWKYVGAHTLGYNNVSIGIAFIGTFNSRLPVKKQSAAFHKLVAKGVQLGYIRKDYKLLGARQLWTTESPGATFMKEIQTWPHWSQTP